MNYVDLDGLERVVVSGGYFNNREDKPYQYEFIDSALREVMRYGGTLFIADVGLTQADKDQIALLRAISMTCVNGMGVEFNVVYFSDIDELTELINNGHDGNREYNPITHLTLFSHGYANTIAFGHGHAAEYQERLTWCVTDLENLDPAAFDNTRSTFFSCNTGTFSDTLFDGSTQSFRRRRDGVETSFAQEWSNLTGGRTTAAEGFTYYGYINTGPRLLSRLLRAWLSDSSSRPGPAVNRPIIAPGDGNQWRTFTPDYEGE